jgi:hypothetical protein
MEALASRYTRALSRKVLEGHEAVKGYSADALQSNELFVHTHLPAIVAVSGAIDVTTDVPAAASAPRAAAWGRTARTSARP